MTRTEDSLSSSVVAGLVAMGLAVLVIANDFTALSVALPAMEKEFGADITTVQWVINGYTLVFGVLIVTGGRLADMFGRRRIFFAKVRDSGSPRVRRRDDRLRQRSRGPRSALRLTSKENSPRRACLAGVHCRPRR